MEIRKILDIIQDQRQGRAKGVSRGPRVKPGRKIRAGVLCYDGTGTSGYAGRCSAPTLRELELTFHDRVGSAR